MVSLKGKFQNIIMIMHTYITFTRHTCSLSLIYIHAPHTHIHSLNQASLAFVKSWWCNCWAQGTSCRHSRTARYSLGKQPIKGWTMAENMSSAFDSLVLLLWQWSCIWEDAKWEMTHAAKSFERSFVDDSITLLKSYLKSGKTWLPGGL